jgi:hypothetical protein
MEELFTSKRRFQIWFFTTSHSILLLRSTKSNQVNTRLDVVFKATAFMNLPTILNGLTIALDTDRTCLPVSNKSSWTDRNVYKLSGDNFIGCIVADSVFWKEDDKEFFEPSELLSDMGSFTLPI